MYEIRPNAFKLVQKILSSSEIATYHHCLCQMGLHLFYKGHMYISINSCVLGS